VLSRRRREYACELSRRRRDGVWKQLCYNEAVESMHVSYHDLVKTASGICVLSRRRREYASEPLPCHRDEQVSYLEGIGSL